MSAPRAASSRAFFLPVEAAGPARRLFALHDAPPVGVPVRGALLYLPPFAEEMNKSRRMAALQARAAAAAGWHVLRIDLTGTGDSEGDFADANWAAWLADVAAARAWLAAEARHEPWLWGLRLGAVLASQAAAGRPAPGLLLWQPLLQGRGALQAFLRLKAGAAWLAQGSADAPAGARSAPGQPAGPARPAEPTPLQQLQAGQAVEIAGYTLAPALALPMGEAVFAPPPAPARVLAFELSPRDGATLSPALGRALEPLGERARAAVVAGPSFWAAQEIETAPALIEATLAALAAPEAPR